jgi:cellulose synthase (UDP-forming)
MRRLKPECRITDAIRVMSTPTVTPLDGPPLAPPQRGRQALALVALAAGGVYLVWRFGFTLQWETLWLGLPLLLAETWALTAVAFFVFSCWRLTERTPLATRPGATMAILVPTYNEPPDVVRATVLGAIAVRHNPRPEVWVLDDGDRDWVEALAQELGARYLVRPAPRTHAKAGNLNHALEHVDAELLLVLDADHVPLPHFLERTTGYFDDAGVALVQSPQAFFNRSFQHSRGDDDPLLNEQSLFYDVICRGKDRHNAAFWCGSSAVVRRDALVSIGGVATDTVVEDTHTAMKLHAAGWKSVYHHEVLALGLAPEEVTAFLTQRGRWAMGCYQVLRHDLPLLARGLSWRQRLHYFASVSHYLEGPQRLVGLLVPPIVLFTGTVPLSAGTITYLSLFLPHLLLVPLATWAMADGRYSFVDGERFALVRAVVYTRAAAALVRRHVSFAVTPKGAESRGTSPYRAVRTQLAIAGLAVVAACYQTLAQLLGLPGRLTVFAFAATVVWALLSAGLLGLMARWASSVRHRRQAHRFPVCMDVIFATEDGIEEPAVVQDLNLFGIALDSVTPLVVGQVVRVTLPLEDGALTVQGTVASSRPFGDGVFRAGVELRELVHADQNAIIRACFVRPLGVEWGQPGSAAPAEPGELPKIPARAEAA